MMSEGNYYVWMDDKPSGPFTLLGVRGMVESGQISQNTLWSTTGADKWKTIAEGGEEFVPERKKPVVAASAPAWTKEGEKIERLEKWADNWCVFASVSFWGACIVLIIAAICAVEGGAGAFVAGASASGGFVVLGILCRMLAELIYIRAALERKK